MNILVTGAGGQLGREIGRAAAKSSNNFILTDVSPKSDDVKFLDILDRKSILDFVEENRIGVIVNCAAYTDVDRAESDSLTAWRVNSVGPDYLAGAIRMVKGTMIQISTDYVFNGKSCLPYIENATGDPLNEYGKSKRAGEISVSRSFCKSLTIRTSWLFSPYGDNFVRRICDRLLKGESLDVVCDRTASPTYAADFAAMIIKIIDGRLYERDMGIFHYCNEGVCSPYDIAMAVAELLGLREAAAQTEDGEDEEKESACRIRPCRSEDYPTVAQRPKFTVLDKTRLKKCFGKEIPHWRDSLADCIARIRAGER